MSASEPLPRAAAPFVAFSSLLRAHGFRVAPEQTMAFVEAVGLLGPGSMADIYRAGVAVLAPPPDRRPAFDALFRAFFMGQSIAAPAAGEAPDEEVTVTEPDAGSRDLPEPEEINEAGARAATGEVLSARGFAALGEADALRLFRRAAPRRLPRRSSPRRVRAKRGDAWDMRRMLREAVRRDGEVVALARRRRKTRQRRILLLIDVSGSMKAHTDGYMRFAHALTRAGERVEVFTLGTRLTRVTRALRLRNRDQALAMASGLVADWDGGTRIGDALGAFLSVPRFSGFARGALTLVLSDGLERGDHTAMTRAVERLSRQAWRLVWLTPLKGEADYQPETAALGSILAFIDELGDASAVERLCTRVLRIGQRAA